LNPVVFDVEYSEDISLKCPYMLGSKQTLVMQKLISWGFAVFVKEFFRIKLDMEKYKNELSETDEETLMVLIREKTSQLFIDSNVFETLETITVKLEQRNASLEELILLMLNGSFIIYKSADGNTITDSITKGTYNKIFGDRNVGVIVALRLAWEVFVKNGFLSQFTT